MRPPLARLLLAFAAIYLVWGSTFLAIRFAVETLPPLLMMGTRNLAAGLLLLAWSRWRATSKFDRRLWLPAFISGAFCFLGGHGVMAWAEITVPSGLAALLAATLPIWMVLLARVRGQESEWNLRVLAGIAVGFVGVAVLVPIGFSGRPGEGVAALAIVGSEALWAAGAIYSRGVKITVSTSTFAAMQMVSGGALLWAVGLSLGEGSRLTPAAFTARSMLSLGYLLVFGSLVTFTAYTWLLQVCSAAVVSTHSYINPVVAVFLGWWMAGEPVTMRTLAGTAIVLASVALLGMRRRRPRPVPDS